MTNPTSPQWREQVIAEFNAADARAAALAKTLTVEQLNWRSGPGKWSIGQCLDHLRVANEVYLAPMTRALEGKPPGVATALTPGWFGRWFIRTAIEPSAASRKGKAPKKIVPIASVDATILDRFLASNDDARDLVERASGYDVNRIRFQNPFVPVIWFTVGTGIEILWRHQRRHLLQAEGIRQSAGFPAR
jgi:hypothetical protein